MTAPLGRPRGAVREMAWVWLSWGLGLGGAQLVRCGTTTFAPAAPAPQPSLRNQFSSSGLWPVACCIVPVFQSLPGVGGGGDE